jgi:hypothetical protein
MNIESGEPTLPGRLKSVAEAASITIATKERGITLKMLFMPSSNDSRNR